MCVCMQEKKDREREGKTDREREELQVSLITLQKNHLVNLSTLFNMKSFCTYQNKKLVHFELRHEAAVSMQNDMIKID